MYRERERYIYNITHTQQHTRTCTKKAKCAQEGVRRHLAWHAAAVASSEFELFIIIAVCLFVFDVFASSLFCVFRLFIVLKQCVYIYIYMYMHDVIVLLRSPRQTRGRPCSARIACPACSTAPMYIHMCVHIHIHIYIYIYMHISIYICEHIVIYVIVYHMI